MIDNCKYESTFNAQLHGTLTLQRALNITSGCIDAEGEQINRNKYQKNIDTPNVAATIFCFRMSVTVNLSLNLLWAYWTPISKPIDHYCNAILSFHHNIYMFKSNGLFLGMIIHSIAVLLWAIGGSLDSKPVVRKLQELKCLHLYLSHGLSETLH